MAVLKRGAAAIPNADTGDAPASRPLLRRLACRVIPLGVIFCLVLVLLCLPPQLPAAQTAASPGADSLEHQVKAAFLLNFTKFVEWPAAAFAAPESPIRICVVGEDPFGATLDRTVEGESVNGRAVKAERLPRGSDPRSCHVVFLGRSERERMARILSELRGSSALTVSELPGFAEAGGMIEFFIEERKVRFYINATAAEDAGLKLSSKLLKVARVVKGRTRK